MCGVWFKEESEQERLYDEKEGTMSLDSSETATPTHVNRKQTIQKKQKSTQKDRTAK